MFFSQQHTQETKWFEIANCSKKIISEWKWPTLFVKTKYQVAPDQLTIPLNKLPGGGGGLLRSIARKSSQ